MSQLFNDDEPEKKRAPTILEQYQYAVSRVEKTSVRSPGIAKIWQEEADLLKERLGSEE